MSGDVQPRKRKDKRRKKDEFTSEPALGKRSLSTESDGEEPPHVKNIPVEKDENIHVHHDHGIGGNAFVKIIFFALLAVLLGLVGLIFIESRGSTDVDLPSIEESRFAEYFTGWLDDAPDDHGHDEPALSEEADDEHEHDDHDDHEDHSEEPDEEEGHSEAEEDEEGASATEEDHQEDENSEEPPVDSNAEDEDSEEAENTAEEDDNDEEEDDSGAKDDNETEEEEEDSGAKDDNETEEEDSGVKDDSEDEEPENDTAEAEENNESVEVDDDDNQSELDEDNDDPDDEGDDDEEDEEYDLTQEDESMEEPKVVIKLKVKTVEDDQHDDETDNDDDKSQNDDDNDEAEIDDDNKNDEQNASVDENSVEIEKAKPTLGTSDEDDVEEIEESEEALKEEEEAVKKEKISLLEDDEDLSDISDIKLRKKREKELLRKLEKMLKEQEKKENSDNDEAENDDNNDAEGEEAKETGGAAEETQDDVNDVNETADNEEIEPVVSRRQTLIPESVDIPNDEYEDEEIDEEYSDDEIVEKPIKRRTSMDVKLERQDATKYYTKEELGDSEDLEDEEELLGEEEEELEEEELGEEEEEEDYELERSQTPSDLGDAEEEYEEEEDEVEPTPPPRANVPTLRRGPQDNDLDEQTDNVDFEETVILQESSAADDFEDDKEFLEDSAENKLEDKNDDWLFRQELNFADDQLLNNPQSALDAYSRIIAKSSENIRALIGRAKALDSLAHDKRSNVLLGQAVEEYQKLLTEPKFKLNNLQFKELASQCIKRMKFAGKNLQSVIIYEAVIRRYPEEVEHRNGLAISYLMAGRNNQAYKVLEETLKKWPNDGVALVHIGFILKNSMAKLEEGAEMLEKGLNTNQTGTIDGRFFFHLGDALHRLGRNDEAFKWYELGVEKGLFKSKYQRSLYNVDRLKARPWWSLEDTTYHQFFRSLEKNWQKIREEGMSLLRARETKLFQDEAENLKDTGDWKQLDLYSRGRKQAGCTRAPFTCQLIGGFAPAASCTRGQAKFSVMEPGTHVWAHCGPTNCRLRAHLGLVVPSGVFIRVAQKTESWKEGKILVFDDSFEHEVWHNGTSVRLVLIVDVWHPELTQQERQTLSPI